MDNYANHPKTINEIKSEKTSDGKEWKPRDALIDLLRDIDSGKLTIKNMIISFEDEDDRVCFRATHSDSPLKNVGLLELIKAKYIYASLPVVRK